MDPVQNNITPPGTSPTGFDLFVTPQSTSTNQEYLDTIASLQPAIANLLNISSSNPQLIKPALFVINQSIAAAIIANRSNSYDSDTTISRVNATFYREAIFVAANLFKVLNEVLAIQRRAIEIYNTINQDIGTQNLYISTANLGKILDNNQTSYMNNQGVIYNNAVDTYLQAKAQYEAGQINEAQFNLATAIYQLAKLNYQSAVTNYNNYVATRNPSINDYNNTVDDYNNKVDANNAILAEVNKDLATKDAQTLPNQSKLLNAKLDPLSTAADPSDNPAHVSLVPIVSSNLIPIISPYNPPMPNLLLDFIVKVLFPNLLTMLNLVLNSVAINQSSNEFYNFFLRTDPSKVTLPNAFSPEVNRSVSNPQGSGFNALGVIANGLDPVIVSQLYNNANMQAYFRQFTSELGLGVFDATLAANSSMLANVVVGAAERLYNKLIEQGLSIEDAQTLSAAIALEFTSAFLDANSGTGLVNGLADLLALDPSNPTINTLNALLTLSNTGVAVSLLSSTLGLPGLGAQLFAAAGLSTDTLFNLTSQGNDIRGFLLNPLTQGLAGGVLATSVINSLGGDLSLTQQEAIRSSILQAAAQTSPLSPDNFFSNLTQILNNNGITGDLAGQILAQAQLGINKPIADSRGALRAQLVDNFLGQGFSLADANSLATALSGTSAGSETFKFSDLNSSLFQSNLAYNLGLIGMGNTSDIVNSVLQSFSANVQEVNEATFRDSLKQQLIANGLSADEALRVASGVALPFTTAANPLVSFTAMNQQSYEALRNDLTAHIRDHLTATLGADAAAAEATRYTNMILGAELSDPKSLVNTISQAIVTLQSSQDQALFDIALDSLKDYLKPSTDLFTFNERLVNSAYSILYAQDLIHQQSTNTGTVKMGGTNPNPIMGPA